MTPHHDNTRPSVEPTADDASELEQPGHVEVTHPPLDVRLVEAAVIIDRAARAWRGTQVVVGTNPGNGQGQQIASHRPNRRAITVFNAGTKTVFVDGDPNVSPTSGCPIPAGMSVTIPSMGAVYACTAVGEVTTVGMISTYEQQ